MTTITAVELRKNLGRYMKMAGSGQKIKVTYRNNRSAVLGPLKDTEVNGPAVFAAAKAFHESLPESVRADLAKLTDEDIEKIREQHMREKYGL